MTDAHNLRRCSDDEIGSLLQRPGTLVVEFSTGWCLPCLLLKPVTAQLALEFRDAATFVAVDADDAERFRMAHDLADFPQLLVFRDGALVDRRIGHDTAANARTFVAGALDMGSASVPSPADRQFAATAGSAHDSYMASTAALAAEVDRHMDSVAPVMDALEEELKAAQASGTIDADGAMVRRSAEWERVSAPFRDRLDALNAATRSALATYQATMAEALAGYASAKTQPAGPVGQVCGPNNFVCRLRPGAA